MSSVELKRHFSGCFLRSGCGSRPTGSRNQISAFSGLAGPLAVQAEAAGLAELPVCSASCRIQYVSDAAQRRTVRAADRGLPPGEHRAGKPSGAAHTHTTTAALSFVVGYFQVKAGVENTWVEQQVWRSDLYLSCGILGFGVLFLLSVTSLPSVGNNLNWREFTLVQVSRSYVYIISVLSVLPL